MEKKHKRKEPSNPSTGHSALEDKYLEHFLSPILKAANAANFHPFTYHFGGYDLRIGQDICAELLKISNMQLSLCKELMTQIRELLIETNGEHAEFLSTPVKDMGFSTRTRHGLISCFPVLCNTMLDVAKLGSYRVSRLRMLGPKSVQEVRQAFIKAGCVELFDTERNDEN